MKLTAKRIDKELGHEKSINSVDKGGVLFVHQQPRERIILVYSVLSTQQCTAKEETMATLEVDIAGEKIRPRHDDARRLCDNTVVVLHQCGIEDKGNSMNITKR